MVFLSSISLWVGETFSSFISSDSVVLVGTESSFPLTVIVIMTFK